MSDEYRTITYEVERGRARIALNRPEKRNAISVQMQLELEQALWAADDDTRVHCVVLSGNGPSFCSGGDLAEFGTFADPASAHLARTRHSPALALDALTRRLGRGGRARQPAALDPRQMLTDAVDLVDVGAASEQRPVQALLVVQRDPWRRQGKQSRAAARDQAERQVVGAEAFDEIQDPLRRLLPCGVWNGMGGFNDLDPLQGTDAVAITRDDQA